jgi:hypothetical protein
MFMTLISIVFGLFALLWVVSSIMKVWYDTSPKLESPEREYEDPRLIVTNPDGSKTETLTSWCSRHKNGKRATPIFILLDPSDYNFRKSLFFL